MKLRPVHLLSSLRFIPFKFILQIIALPIFLFFVSANLEAQNAGNDISALIIQADQAFAVKDYATALMLYQKANTLKPNDAKAKARLVEINSVFDSNPALKAQLIEDHTLKAEDFLSKKNYPSAKTEYHKVLALDPSAQFPKDRLTEISKLYTDPADQAYFDNAVSDGDKQLAKNNYTQAIQSYETALTVKPDSKFIKDKILNTKKMQSEAEAREKQSATIVTAADKLLAAGKQAEAKVEYEKALLLSPGNASIQQKVAAINQEQAAKNAKQQSFDKAIEEADNFYINRDFVNARARYQAALAIKPEARYPKEMLQKTESGESQLKTEQERYDAVIANADEYLKNNEFTLAKESYTAALAIKPSESYPKTKISEIEKTIATLESREKSYQKALQDADQAYADKDYSVALTQYNSALKIKPGENYPASKINEINALIVSEKTATANYQNAINEGDKLFGASRFSESIIQYEKAIAYKPNETYAQKQLEAARTKALEQKSKEENYADAILRADGFYTKGDLENALKSYNEALSAKPAEKYPKEKADEISKTIAKQKSDNNSFDQFIAQGDKAYANKNLDQALIAYKEALKYKPEALHPAERVAEITRTLASQKEADANYALYLAEGDKCHAAKDYQKAIENYTLALQVKPDEIYPKNQIEKINQIVASDQLLDANYGALIKNGDAKMAEQNYTEALAAYTSAQQLKKNETYPTAQINKINTLLAENKKRDDAYKAEIAIADKLFAEAKFTESIVAYTKALTIIPDEKYATGKINDAKTKIEEDKKLQQDYQQSIADADASMSKKEYTQAMTSYETALRIKPTESYPNQKIAEIRKIVDKEKSDNELYSQAITSADAAYDGKRWEDAIASYEKAKSFKPQDSYAENRLQIAKKALETQKTIDNSYLTEIASADQLFESKKFEESIIAYKKALTIKPSEAYPSNQIETAENQIKLLAQQQLEYDQAIKSGEAAFAAKDWNKAVLEYEKASKLKPAEDLPKQKIAELTVLIDKEKSLNQQYADALKLADELFNSNKLREALEPYQRANTLKAGEKYPVEQIALINKLLAEQKKRDDDFAALIADSEQLLKLGNMQEARLKCSEALSLKKDEKQGLDLLSKIDNLLAKEKADNDNYNHAIEQANALLASGELAKAIPYYEQALSIKPNEKFPAEKIQSINAELKRQDDLYKLTINEADAMLSNEKFQEALNTYQKALELKNEESYPKQKIQDINNLLSSRKEEQQRLYTAFITEADRFFAAGDYYSAKTEYTKAIGIKQDETYPKQKLDEVNALIKQIEETRQVEYRKAVGEADKLYNTKVYDQAIDAYEAVLKLNYPDPYPSNQIAKIRKYLDDHAIQDLSTSIIQIDEGAEKKFNFTSIEPRLRKNNYILMKARSTGTSSPKVYLNYGRDGIKNGGIVLRSLDKKEITDYLIRISVQDKWYREDNNWISISVETGAIEIAKIQIAAGD